jgi:hypothetical protein
LEEVSIAPAARAEAMTTNGNAANEALATDVELSQDFTLEPEAWLSCCASQIVLVRDDMLESELALTVL